MASKTEEIYKQNCQHLRGVLKHGFSFGNTNWWFKRSIQGDSIFIGFYIVPLARVDRTTVTIVPSPYQSIFESFAATNNRELKWVNGFKVNPERLSRCTKLDWWTKKLLGREQPNARDSILNTMDTIQQEYDLLTRDEYILRRPSYTATYGVSTSVSASSSTIDLQSPLIIHNHWLEDA